MSTLKTTDNSFKIDVLDLEKPVLVDFWAEWWTCKSIAPSLEEISNEMNDKLVVAKINIDENPMIAQKYEIRRFRVNAF